MGSVKKNRAVFLDRDGTLNPDPGYLSNPDQFGLFPGVIEALSQLQKAGFELIIVSNQSGVGRGLITLDQIKSIHDKLNSLLAPSGVFIKSYELCFHRPDEECACRKPKPFLLEEAAKRFDIDLSRSFMVGDKCTDVECAMNAGCQAGILVLTGEGLSEVSSKKCSPHHVAQDLKSASDWILSQLDFS